MLKTTFTECPCFHASFCTLESHPWVQGIRSSAQGLRGSPAQRHLVSSRVGGAMWIRVHSGSCPASRAPPQRSRDSGSQEFPSPTPPPACVACSQLLAALTSMVSRGCFLLLVPVGLSPLFLCCYCYGEFGQDLRKQQCLGGPRLVGSPWWVPPVWGEPAEGSGETLQLHTCDFCDSSITLVWPHHGVGLMVKLNTSFPAENLGGLTLRAKFK